jgi:diphosphomevalonate decarboxylase
MLEKKYLQNALGLKLPGDHISGIAAWECPSNIALVKYWGKKHVQRPLNPSVSMTLQEARTILSIEYNTDRKRNKLSLKYIYEDQPNKAFEDRYRDYLQQMSRYLPFLNQLEMIIRARNTFPHSAGIASSASSFGALALALCSIEQSLFGTLSENSEFIEKASFLARLGSGSACRSVIGGYILWGRTRAYASSADEAAVALNSIIHPVFRDYCDSILVIRSGEKEISSSAGHRLMDHHPYASARISQANDNLEKMLSLLKNGNEQEFASLVEEEALTLHALMLTSRPGYMLLKPNSWETIDRIRQFRYGTGLPVCYTLDAGANVHLLYPVGIRPQVSAFIESYLVPLCEQGRVIRDRVGTGPVISTGTYG